MNGYIDKSFHVYVQHNNASAWLKPALIHYTLYLHIFASVAFNSYVTYLRSVISISDIIVSYRVQQIVKHNEVQFQFHHHHLQH